MGLKFDVGNWKFELTLRELHCQPVKKEGNTAQSLKSNGRGDRNQSHSPARRSMIAQSANPLLLTADQLTLIAKRSQGGRTK